MPAKSGPFRRPREIPEVHTLIVSGYEEMIIARKYDMIWCVPIEMLYRAHFAIARNAP